jgi:serine phosphatase RsbU (regulator of sigma subunit)
VGGDFYDVFELPRNRLGMAIADVSDKGMPAALYMTVTRTLIRATAQEEESPARVLMRVNNLLLMDAQYGMFVTAVYLVVDLRSGDVTYANAGHNIPLWIHGHTKAVSPLHKGGMAMAVLNDTPLEDHHMVINEGEALLLYTDGVTETFSPAGELFGEERLEAILTKTGGLPARQIIEAIDQAIQEFSAAAPATDDVTLLAIRRLHRHTIRRTGLGKAPSLPGSPSE